MLPQYRLDTDFSKEAYAENLSTIASELSILQPISKVIFLCPIPIKNCTYMKKFCAASKKQPKNLHETIQQGDFFVPNPDQKL